MLLLVIYSCSIDTELISVSIVCTDIISSNYYYGQKLFQRLWRKSIYIRNSHGDVTREISSLLTMKLPRNRTKLFVNSIYLEKLV